MSALGTSDDFTIMRLRVKGSKLDPLAIRPRMQQLISELRLHPLLPESASLFIRRLEDPSPGLLRLEAIDSRVTQAWRHSFNSKFRELVTSAARPARGPVSSSAESVVFLDYSELLACLTADWCNGFVGTRWWWHSFLKRGDIEQVIKKFWQEKIEYAPAALQQLSKRRVLVEFVAALSDRETRDLVERVVEKFALTGLRVVVASLPEEFVQPRLEARVEKVFMSSAGAAREADVGSVTPWRYVVPEADTPKLRPMQQLFLGVALMIKRAPAQVRTQVFAREVERWQSGVLSGVETEVESKEVEKSGQLEEPRALDRETQILRIKTDRSVAARQIEFPELRIEDQETREMVSARVVLGRVDEGVGIVPELMRAEELRSEAVVDGYATPVEIEPMFESTPEVIDEGEDSFTIETELGGFFYLINLAIFLEIYSDFTSPVETFTELDIWHFVALVGAELNGHQDPDDPIWWLLEELSPQRRKGAEEDLRLPGGSDFCAFASLRGRVWLGHLMPYLRKRLRLALGTDDFPNLVCRRRARVTVTATHIHVFFSLAELPIEIRLAGLDRDPGWVPAAGRFIAFHFE